MFPRGAYGQRVPENVILRHEHLEPDSTYSPEQEEPPEYYDEYDLEAADDYEAGRGRYSYHGSSGPGYHFDRYTKHQKISLERAAFDDKRPRKVENVYFFLKEILRE